MSIESVLNRIESIKERIDYYSSFVNTVSVGSRDITTRSRSLADFPKRQMSTKPTSSFKQVMEGVAKEREGLQQEKRNKIAKFPPPLFKQEMEGIDEKDEKEKIGLSKVAFVKKGILNPQSKGEEISSLIQAYGTKYDVDPLLISSIIKAESNFNPKAVSLAGAEGLMQLMPGTAKELGVKNSLDVEENIEAGVRYFKGLLDRFGGSLELALAAYNAGPERVEDAGGIPNIKETKNYVNRVLRYYKQSTIEN